MILILLVISLVAAASGQGSRCCLPSKWSAYMSDIRSVAKGNDMSSLLNYDHDNKEIAIQFFRFTGGNITTLTRVVTRYAKSKRYTIDPDGSCRSNDMKGEVMLPNCIPDTGRYLGSNYIGPETTGVKYDAWNIPLGNLNITLLYSNPGCVPLNEGVVGDVSSDPVDTAFVFSGYRPLIQDQTVFNVPQGC